jgi:hypothetical protein
MDENLNFNPLEENEYEIKNPFYEEEIEIINPLFSLETSIETFEYKNEYKNNEILPEDLLEYFFPRGYSKEKEV